MEKKLDDRTQATGQIKEGFLEAGRRSLNHASERHPVEDRNREANGVTQNEVNRIGLWKVFSAHLLVFNDTGNSRWRTTLRTKKRGLGHVCRRPSAGTEGNLSRCAGTISLSGQNQLWFFGIFFHRPFPCLDTFFSFHPFLSKSYHPFNHPVGARLLHAPLRIPVLLRTPDGGSRAHMAFGPPRPPPEKGRFLGFSRRPLSCSRGEDPCGAFGSVCVVLSCTWGAVWSSFP